MLNFNKKTNLTFYQIITIGFGFLSTIIFLGFNLYPKLYTISNSLINKLESTCGCANHWAFGSHPFIFSSIIFASLILTAFISLFIIKIFKLNKDTLNFINLNIIQKQIYPSHQLKQVSQKLNLNNKIIEIDSQQPVIFCYGFLNPKICISSKLTSTLTSQELQAVLLHEKYHIQSYDPLKIFITKIIATTLFFIPSIKFLSNKYQTLAELSADESATQNFKNKTSLASALYKIMRLKENISPNKNLAISFFATIDERVNKLTNDKYTPHFKIFTPKSISLLLITIISIVSFYLPIYSAKSAIPEHTTTSSCIIEQKTFNYECQMFLDNSICLEYNQQNISPECIQ